MPRFDINDTKQLKEFLYNSCVHDAKIENVEYICEKDIIKIGLFNPIFNVKIGLTFHNIGLALAIKGNVHGNRKTIISLTAEEDFSYLRTYLQDCDGSIEGYLYLLFQMFSGDEFHIVCKQLVVEIQGSI